MTADAPNNPIKTLQVGQDTDTTIVALNDNDDGKPMLAVGVIKESGDSPVFLYTDIINTDVRVAISVPTTANCASTGCLFGSSVALFNQTLVVGSPGSLNDANKLNAGRAFVYNNVTEDGFEAKVQPLPPSADSQLPINALFGSSVAIADGAVVVGSPKYSR